MKTPAALALLILTASSSFADFLLDFNTPGQFTGNFSSAQPGPITQSNSGGLGNSGSLDLSGMTGGETAQQIVTFDQAFSADLSSWSASVYYYGNAQHFWQFGVTTVAAPALVDGYAHDGTGYAPGIWVESGNADDGSFAVGSYDGVTETVYDTHIVSGGLPATAAWYKYTIEVSYLGLGTYSLLGNLSESDANGMIGTSLSTATLSVENAALAADSSVYLFLNLYDGVAVDDFTTNTYAVSEVPEPATWSALAGLLTLGFAFWRRQTRRTGRAV